MCQNYKNTATFVKFIQEQANSLEWAVADNNRNEWMNE